MGHAGSKTKTNYNILNSDYNSKEFRLEKDENHGSAKTRPSNDFSETISGDTYERSLQESLHKNKQTGESPSVHTTTKLFDEGSLVNSTTGRALCLNETRNERSLHESLHKNKHTGEYPSVHITTELSDEGSLVHPTIGSALCLSETRNERSLHESLQKYKHTEEYPSVHITTELFDEGSLVHPPIGSALCLKEMSNEQTTQSSIEYNNFDDFDSEDDEEDDWEFTREHYNFDIVSQTSMNNCDQSIEITADIERGDCIQTTDDEPEIVIAIDFGTTFTGFAFSFTNNRSSIETGKQVLGEDRVPTVVLLKPDNTIHSVGSKAEDTYGKLALRNKHKEYRLFSRFKMALYMNEHLTHDSTIPDNDGEPMLALELFTIVIRHMRKIALNTVSGSLLGNKERIEDRILWILTIPAIWSDSARQFMHEVFVNAGIAEKQLRLVLEPEAAAIYCRNDILHRSDKYEIGKLPAGTKYLLADLGGGTVDICSHEIIENNRIREIHRATGGAFGGTFVDDQFKQAVIKIFGSDVFRKFQRDHFLDYLSLVNEFEKSKRNFGQGENDEENEMVITVPNSLNFLLQDSTQCCIEDIVRQGSYSKSIEFCDGKLIFKRELMEDFFSKSVHGIISRLKEIVNKCKDEDIKSILLVGGYAESKYVTDKIKKSMEEFGIEVIVVVEPRLSVMKGAVMLGYEDRKIVQRKSRVTYGFKIARTFIKGVHPEKYKFERDGEYLCDNIFKKLIEKDQYVEYGQEFKTTTSTNRRFQESKTENVSISVVVSEKSDPTYCSEEEECKKVGEIIIEPPEGGWPDENEKEMYLIVQEDIMLCRVIDKTCGGKEYTTQVDFLSKSV